METKKDVTIFLDVQAKALFDGGSTEDNCEFSDDNNGKPKWPLKEFKTEIFNGKFLTWEIRLQGPDANQFSNTKIRITFKNNSPFNDLILEKNSFRLKEKIKDNAGIMDYKYEFQFSLKHDGNTKDFTIDPILRINPQPLDPS